MLKNEKQINFQIYKMCNQLTLIITFFGKKQWHN